MDIDDILAEVSGPSQPQEIDDHQELTRAWVNEKNAPEILPWPEELMDRVLARIRKQVRTATLLSIEKVSKDLCC